MPVNKPERGEPSEIGEPVAARLAEFASAFTLDSVPEGVVQRAKLSLLDAFGIGLAATTSDFGACLATALAGLDADGRYPVIGMDLKLSPRDAAHFNGTLIHGLDFDDTHTESVVHTSASAAPTALVAGIMADASGREMLSAFVIASECASRIGAAARGGFHDKGFHPTGVVGAFGATLAAGYLGGLSLIQMTNAQGIVLSQAGGSMQFLDDGAWTKRNHPGWASACALTATAMAKAGFSGPAAPYFGRYGLYALYTADPDAVRAETIIGDLGSRWEMSHVAFKPYPACHLVHAFADAALRLKHEHRFSVDDIRAIRCLIHPSEVPLVCEPESSKKKPQNAYDAQFSVHYIVSAALVRDRFGLAELSDDAITDPEILKLCGRVSYGPDPESGYPDFFSGVVEIELANGTKLRHREQHNRGTAENPLSADEIRAKFAGNATTVLGQPRIQALEQCILNLEQEPNLQMLTRLLCSRP